MGRDLSKQACSDQSGHAALAGWADGAVRAYPVEEFSQDVRRVCGAFAVDVDGQSQGAVNGNVTTVRISRFETAVVTADVRRVIRDSRMVRSDPGEHLFLLVQDQGHCGIRQGDRSTLLGPGDMFVVDSAYPSEFIYDNRRSRQISVHLPRDEMLHRFGPICEGGIGIDSTDPLFLAMRAVLTKNFAIDGAVIPVLGEALLDLFGAYFHCLERQQNHRERAANAVLSRALALIERHAHEPEFGAQELAAMLSVSPRTLQRHFGALGETASKRLLAVRLEAARSRLETLGGPGRDKVASIAYESGFNDLSYFYRVFRERFGCAPGAMRKKG